MGLNSDRVQLPSLPIPPESPDAPYRRQPWYAAYMAALFEADRKQIPLRIRYAEQLVLARERELLSRRAKL